MSLGLEYGGVLPNNQQSPVETYQQMRMYNDQQARYQQQMQRQQEMDDAAKAKYMADNLNFDQYGTGTEYDPIVHETLNSAVQSHANMIKNGVSWADLVGSVASTAQQLSNYSNKAKQIDNNARAYAAQFKNNKSVDPNELYKYYKISAFHDGNGGLVPIDKLNPDQDYGQMALDKYGQHIIKGSGALDDMADKAKMIPYKREWTSNQNGQKRIMGYEGKYSPQYHELIGSDGKPVDENGNATGVRVKGQPIMSQGKPLIVNGQPIMGVNDETMEHFSSDPGAKAYLDYRTKQIMSQNPNLDASEVKKGVLYEYLNQNKRGYINNTKNTIDDSQQWKEEMMRDRMQNSQQFRLMMKTMGAKNAKENPFATLTGYKMGLLNDGEDVPSVQDNEGNTLTGVKDITAFLPNASLFKGKMVKTKDGTASKDAYAKVLFNPATKKFYTQDLNVDPATGEKSYSPAEPVDDDKEWFKKIAEANGHNPQEAASIYENNYKPSPSEQAMEELKKSGVKKNPFWKLYNQFRKPYDGSDK